MLDTVLVELEFGEEGLVEGTSGAFVGVGVEAVTALEQGERDLEALFDEPGVDGGDREKSLGFLYLCLEVDPALLEVGEADRAVEVGVDQLLSSLFEALYATGLGS